MDSYGPIVLFQRILPARSSAASLTASAVWYGKNIRSPSQATVAEAGVLFLWIFGSLPR